MEPAHVTILRPQPEHRWGRLQAVLDAQDAPPVARQQDGSVNFQADTFDLILRSRVADALEEVWGHGEAGRVPAGGRFG